MRGEKSIGMKVNEKRLAMGFGSERGMERTGGKARRSWIARREG